MSDLFATGSRKYIEWAAYVEISNRLSKGSLIGRFGLSGSEVDRRLAELRAAEDQFGFVYVGERQWLECNKENKVTLSYGSWAESRLKEAVFPDGFVYAVEHLLGEVRGFWQAYTEDLSCFWQPIELSCSDTSLIWVSAILPGGEMGATESQWCQLFGVLHDLAYYLNNTGEGWGEVMTFDRVIPFGDGRWFMDLRSERGGGLIFEFNGRETIGPAR